MKKNSLTIELSNDELQESSSRVSFNLAESSYSDSEDSGDLDSCPFRIDGLVYVEVDLTISGQLTTNGIVLVYNDLYANSPTLNLEYNELFFEDPPPGFMESPDMVIMPGSIRPFVD